MDDTAVIAVLGVAAWSFSLFLFTNWHVRRTKKDLQAYGSDARQKTEAFVSRETDTMRTEFRQGIQKLREAIPETSVSDLRGELQDFAKQVGEDLGWMKSQWGALMSDRSAQAQEISRVASEEAAKMRAELGAASQALAPQLQGQGGDIRGQLLKILQREPTAKERKEMGVLGELATAAMKKGLYEWLSGGQLSSGNGRYSLSVPAGDGW